jgi:exodeoxyribonuclease VIII
MTTHVMINLETLGTDPEAMILSLGAVKFDPLAKLIEETFHTAVDLLQAPRNAYGLTIDPGMLFWWLQPERSRARVALSETPKADLASVLDGFALWFGNLSLPVWGNGVAFNNVILRNAFEAMNMDCPWFHDEDRCYQTLKNLFPEVTADSTPGLTAHSALDNAIHQTEHLRKIMRVIHGDI